MKKTYRWLLVLVLLVLVVIAACGPKEEMNAICFPGMTIVVGLAALWRG